MKRFWVSWVQCTEDCRPLNYLSPSAAILGWWRAVTSEEGTIIWACVEARFESDARDAILKDWPEAMESGDWRFFERKPDDFIPDDRFLVPDWMQARFKPTH